MPIVMSTSARSDFPFEIGFALPTDVGLARCGGQLRRIVDWCKEHCIERLVADYGPKRPAPMWRFSVMFRSEAEAMLCYIRWADEVE